MKQARSFWLNSAGLLLALPTAYFISIAILKYEMGIDGPFDAIAPFLEKMGIKETLGWNINLLILFGPVVGCFLVLSQVVKIEWQFTKEQFRFHLMIQKRWFPIMVIVFCLCLLAFLFIYMVGENCNC